ncbi:MAG: HNH endonuclease [Solirubrobacteraceae bacterium]
MTWKKSREDRRRDGQVYGAEWRRQRQRALERDGHRCTQCGSRMHLTVDHIVPVSQGGSHDLSNLATLCETCHHSKTGRQHGYGSQPPKDPPATPRTRWLRGDPPSPPLPW